MPFRSDNALVKAAAVVQRLADYRPAPRFHELWRDRVHRMAVTDEMRAALLDEDAIEDLLAELPNRAAAAHLHACTHTTFSPNVVHGGTKVNVIPDRVEIEVDIRTLPDVTSEEMDALTAYLGSLR